VLLSCRKSQSGAYQAVTLLLGVLPVVAFVVDAVVVVLVVAATTSIVVVPEIAGDALPSLNVTVSVPTAPTVS